jgi:hypothetical protein
MRRNLKSPRQFQRGLSLVSNAFGGSYQKCASGLSSVSKKDRDSPVGLDTYFPLPGYPGQPRGSISFLAPPRQEVRVCVPEVTVAVLSPWSSFLYSFCVFSCVGVDAHHVTRIDEKRDVYLSTGSERHEL